jgi:hypothetical protein
MVGTGISHFAITSVSALINPAFYQMITGDLPRDKNDRNVKMITHFHLKPSLRRYGASHTHSL